MNKKFIIYGVVALVILVVFASMFSYCGRTPSRYLGKDHRQVLKVMHMSEPIGISYDFQDGSTVKNVTYIADDGYAYTQEFKDVSPLEGVIRWVPFDHSDSLIQSRALSRVFGKPVNLKLPEDCKRIVGVEVTYTSKTERTKMLNYISTSGKFLSKEYREGFVDRHLEGWLEVVRAE